MNNCFQCEKLISEYIEGMLDSNTSRQFNKHLKECTLCARKTNDVTALRNNLIALPKKTVSSDFDSMLRATIRLENRREKQKKERLMFSRKIRVPIYGISFVLVLFILISLFSQLSNKNIYLPEASENMGWKNGAAVYQNASSRTFTFYSLERKSAIDVFSQQPSRYLNKNYQEAETFSDSSAENAYDEPMMNLSDNFYRTSF